MNAPARPAAAMPLLTAILMAAVLLISAPAAAQTPSSLFTPKSASSGFYVGAEGGLNWLLTDNSSSFDTGYAVGGVVGYDFVGPRFEVEGVYRGNNGRAHFANSGTFNQLAVMASGYRDLFAGATLTPRGGAGIGLGFGDGPPGGWCVGIPGLLC